MIFRINASREIAFADFSCTTEHKVLGMEDQYEKQI